ncbi:class I SAM-dependent methyltransferase [Nanoarchaeota archaeon]
MKYSEYADNYYEKPKHLPFTKKKRSMLRVVSATPVISSYYYHLVNIIESLPKKAKVLDIGCSHGGFLNFIHNIRPDLQLYGCDLSDVSKLLPKFVKFIQKDVINEDIKQKDFNLVISRHLIEHLQVQDVPKYFDRCYKLLKKGGIFFNLTPRWHKGFYSDPTHIRPYNKNSLRRLYEMSGFKDIKTYNKDDFNFPFNIKSMRLTWGFARK